MTCFGCLEGFKPFLWLSVLKLHDAVTVGLFSPLVWLWWALGGLFNPETHIFQFWEFVLNSFFASPPPLLSSLFYFSNPHYLDLLGCSSSFLTFSPLLIHLFVFLFYPFERFLQLSNYSTVFFIFANICLISNHSFLSSEYYFFK